MATVKGDVHDIGKNIVGVVLACNNYDVIDLGVMVPAGRILETARETDADLIGLSGLITPSLEEMRHVATEMEREGFELPLLIGGATTSRTHTAVKIEPNYHGPVIHVADASRAVGVAGALMDKDRRDAYAAGVREEYETVRRERGARQEKIARHTIAEARRHRLAIDWSDVTPPRPSFLGVRTIDGPAARRARRADRLDAVLRDLGAQRALPGDPVGPEDRGGRPVAPRGCAGAARPDRLGAAARGARGGRVLAGQHASATTSSSTPTSGGAGRWARSTRSASRWSSRPAARTWRSPTSRRRAIPGWSITSAAFAVTAGHRLGELVAGFEAAHDDYSAIMARALADRLAEAFAERLHEVVRRELWGYATDEADLSNADLIAERYQGIRPAPGYPACPDHTEKGPLFGLLEGEARAGIRLTESFAMLPAASVSGYYFWHPQAAYFGLGQIGADQLADYAHRKGMPVDVMARWLAPNLADD